MTRDGEPWREDPWNGRYKIPWDEPEFSRRILQEHLSQGHDLASRRTEWIDRQVAWIHANVLEEVPSRVLDLGCGPGFYAHRLAALGHECHGLDFGPASIEYAKEYAPKDARCTFVLGDVRETPLGRDYDLAMVLFGEINVFSPAECRALLAKARDSLVAGGRLLVELQKADVVRDVGHAADYAYETESGLFCDTPHHCRTENHWLEDHDVALQVFRVTERGSGAQREYRSTTQAWPADRFRGLLTDVGFPQTFRHADWPVPHDSLELWSASRG